MTPTQIELHNAHKARLQRIAQAAARVNPKTDSEFAAALNAVETVEDVKDEWADRQIRYNKPLWFSVVSACKITKAGAPTIRSIQRATCDVFKVRLNDLLSHRRMQPIIIPRQVSMYLAKEMTGLSCPRIGRATGGRDHSTVIHSHRKIEKLISAGGSLAAKVAEIKAILS